MVMARQRWREHRGRTVAMLAACSRSLVERGPLCLPVLLQLQAMDGAVLPTLAKGRELLVTTEPNATDPRARSSVLAVAGCPSPHP